jgi:hypothetical protein
VTEDAQCPPQPRGTVHAVRAGGWGGIWVRLWGVFCDAFGRAGGRPAHLQS